MSEPAPQVSVVIPTRNRARYIRGAVDTALRQEDVEVEVIVVDDASDDETPEILRDVGDPRVTVLIRDTRGGVAAARNAGLEAARHEWVAFLDDDDLWAPHKLRTQIAAAQHRQGDFAYAGALAVDDRLNPLYLWQVPQPEVLLKELLAINVVPAGASSVVAHAGLLRSVGLFDERFSHCSDWDLWIRLAAQGRAVHVPEVLTAYRLHSHGQHGDLGHEVLDELDLIEEKHADLRARHGVDVDRASLESYVAKRALQAEGRAAESRRSLARRLARHIVRLIRPRTQTVAPEAPDWLKTAARAARREPRGGATRRSQPRRSAPTRQ